jgi:8-oxo-dGTP diphosphatase
MTRSPLPEDYPNLFRAVTWGAISYRFQVCAFPPPVESISNVNLVPFAGEQVLMIRLQDGRWEIPGGTLEPGESYVDALRRELLEEAGACLLEFNLFGARHCRSLAKSYRLHLPHPEFYRVVGWGEVEVIGVPQNPKDGEQVVAVDCGCVEEASQRFYKDGRPELAELYRLAAAMRQSVHR